MVKTHFWAEGSPQMRQMFFGMPIRPFVASPDLQLWNTNIFFHPQIYRSAPWLTHFSDSRSLESSSGFPAYHYICNIILFGHTFICFVSSPLPIFSIRPPFQSANHFYELQRRFICSIYFPTSIVQNRHIACIVIPVVSFHSQNFPNRFDLTGFPFVIIFGVIFFFDKRSAVLASPLTELAFCKIIVCLLNDLRPTFFTDFPSDDGRSFLAEDETLLPHSINFLCKSLLIS